MGQMMIYDILATPAWAIHEKGVQPWKDSDCCERPGLALDGAVTATTQDVHEATRAFA